MPSPLISGTAHAQFAEGLHFSAFHFVNSSEGESGNGWESESEAIDDDSLYFPTPDRPVGGQLYWHAPISCVSLPYLRWASF